MVGKALCPYKIIEPLGAGDSSDRRLPILACAAGLGSFSLTMNPTDGSVQIQGNGKNIERSRRRADGSWKIARGIWTRLQTARPSAPLWSVFLLALVMAARPAASAHRDIFVVNVDGSNLVNLTNNPGRHGLVAVLVS